MGKRSVSAVVAVVLLLGLAAVELWQGLWFSTDPLDQMNLARNRQSMVAGGAGGGAFVYRRNHQGLRGADMDAARIHILTLGGVATDQPNLPEDQTWQSVMERDFQAMGKDVTVANGGLSGASTVELIQVFDRWLPNLTGLKPSFVIIPVGLEDATLTGETGDRFGFSSTARLISRKSGLVRLWKSLAGERERQMPATFDFAAARWTAKSAAPDFMPDDQAQPKAYAQRLREMAQRVHDLGAVPVFVTQVRGDWRLRNGHGEGVETADPLNGVDHHRLLNRLNRATLALCQDEGWLCLDWAGDYHADPGDFHDFIHMTAQGAQKLGHWLAGKLAGLA